MGGPPRPLGGALERRVQRKGLRPRYAAYVIIAVWVVGVVVFGVIERLVDPDTFHTVWLGMWWALETVTTVGYGDNVPMTLAGRIAAVLVMLVGIGFLTVITAAITSTFVSRSGRQQTPLDTDAALAEHFRRLDGRLERIEAALGRSSQP